MFGQVAELVDAPGLASLFCESRAGSNPALPIILFGGTVNG